MKKRWKRVLALASAAAMTAAGLSYDAVRVQAQEDDTGDVYEAVITNRELQVMDGLGGSIAFNKAYSLHKVAGMNPERSEELFDLLFDDEKGIGLDIVRVLLGDGGITNPQTGAEWGNRWYDGPSDTIWPEPGQENIVWNRDDWPEKKSSFDEDQIWFMKKAMEYGVHTFYADAWSPPYWMKQNNSVLGQSSGVLKQDCYDDYAYYLVEYALGYMREFGIPITHIGPTNESEAAHSGYSGFILQGEDYKRFIVDYLGPELERRKGEFEQLGMEVPKVVGPEGTNMGVSTNMQQTQGWGGLTGSLYGKTLSDENVQKVISVFSTHLYGSASMFDKGPATAGMTNNYPEFLRSYTLWQTEYMTQNNSDSSARANTQIYANQGIKDGVYWANLISNMFASDPGFNAYLWWWPLGANGADGSDLIRFCNTGSPQGNGSTVTGEYRLFKRFYTFGNFSRFVNPGDIRLEADRVPADGMNVTAYKDPETNEYKIVAVNNGLQARTISFTFDGDYPLTGSSVIGYRTTASENQKRMDAIPLTGRSFTVQIPAQSVITFVPENGHNLPGLNDKRDIFSTLEAEDNDGTSTAFGTVETADGTAVTGMGNGSYLKFANINFNEGSANGGIVRRHVLSMDMVASSIRGGQIEARVDDPVNGKLVGLFTIPGKNDPDTYEHYTSQIDTGDTGAYGYHDLYLVFCGNGTDLFRIDRFEFGEQIAESGNLLQNPGFEQVPGDTWTSPSGSADTQYERTTEQNYSAPLTEVKSTTAYSLKITNRGETQDGAAQKLAQKLENGGTYYAGAFFMPVREGASGSIVLECLDEQGKVIQRQTVAQRGNLEKYVWSEIDGIFTCQGPETEAASMRIVLTDDSGDTLYLEEASLIPYYDKTDLIAVLDTEYDPSRYLEQDLAALQAAMEKGWKCVSDPETVWADIAAAENDVQEALKKTLPVLERGDLLAAIEEARAVDGSLYTPESYGVLMEKVAEAQELMDNDVINGVAVTQEDVDHAALVIREAADALIDMPAPPEWQDLKKAIARAQSLNPDHYTEESYAAVSSALAQAIALLKGDVSGGDVTGGDVTGGDVSGNGLQGRIDLAAQKLWDAIAHLEDKEIPPEPARKSGLQNAVDMGNAVDPLRYTQMSYDALMKAVRDGEAVLEDREAGQEVVNAAEAAIRQALNGLVEKNEGGNNPGEDGNPGGGDENPGGNDNPGGGNTAGAGDSGNSAQEVAVRSPKTYDEGISALWVAAGLAAALASGAGMLAYFRKRGKQQ